MEEIKEMAKIYCQNGFKCEENCQTNGCRVYEVCAELYKANYRKREETIKEVFTWLPQALRELYASGKWIEWKDLAEKVKEKFGVEIEYEM